MDDVIKVKDYTIKKSEYLGKGQYGIVYGCYSDLHKDKKLCAKVLQAQIDKNLIKRELDILQSLNTIDNPHLIKIYGVIEEEKQIFIIMEKCSGGDLKSLMDNVTANRKQFSLQQIVEIARQIVLGYKSLFDKKIIHRDIKPANILISSEKEGELLVKLTDFGMGKILEDITKKQMMTKVGTPAYAAPQLYLEDTYSSKCDVYSLGVILYQLAYNRLPFNARTIPELTQFLKELKTKPLQCPPLTQDGPEQMKREIQNLINKMMSYGEDVRPGWDDLMKSPLINGEKLKTALPTGEEAKLMDSIFLLQQQQGREQFFNEDIFRKVAKHVSANKITKTDRINHLVSLFLAKAELAFALSITLNEELPKALPYFNNYHYELIQTCVIGYRYKILLNAFGFCFNNINFICEEMRKLYDNKALQATLLEYQQDKSDYTSQIKENISSYLEKSNEAFLHAENQVIKLMKCNQYPQNITNFQKLLSIVENTEFKIYGRWFQFFWKQELRKQLVYDKSKQYDIGYLRLLAIIEKFLMIDIDFSFDKYSEQDPLNIVMDDKITKQQLEAIIQARKNV